MDVTNGPKEAVPATARVASNTLGVNVFTAPEQDPHTFEVKQHTSKKGEKGGCT